MRTKGALSVRQLKTLYGLLTQFRTKSKNMDATTSNNIFEAEVKVKGEINRIEESTVASVAK